MMPVRNPAGAVVSFIGVQSDITELIRRKHAERELQQAKVRCIFQQLCTERPGVICWHLSQTIELSTEY